MRNLILVTNDDGINSPGLWSIVEAVQPLGEVLVVAPDRQWSGGGRSMPPHVTGRLTAVPRVVNGETISAFAVDASPALAVDHGVLELAPRRPDLVISGVNFGANLGIEVTISGTVGAALEGGAFGVPSMAVSLQMADQFHLTGDERADYAASAVFTRMFASFLLEHPGWTDVDAWNINVPAAATLETPWRVTRLSRWRYFIPLPPDRNNGHGRLGYRVLEDCTAAESDSDVWALMVEGIISVTPLTLDLTSRVKLTSLEQALGVGLSPVATEMAALANSS